MSSPALERRRAKRRSVSISCRVGPWEGTILDISADGAGLRTVEQPIPGPYGLRFNIDGLEYRVRVKAIHWREAGGHFWGCQFTDIADTRRTSLAALVEGLDEPAQVRLRRDRTGGWLATDGQQAVRGKTDALARLRLTQKAAPDDAAKPDS